MSRWPGAGAVVSCAVTQGDDDSAVVATQESQPGTGPAAASARLRLVGEAALRAIESLLDGDVLALDSIGNPAIGMKTVIVAVVVATGDRGEEISVGSALSSGDDSETAVRAVLDAVNRRIGRR